MSNTGKLKHANDRLFARYASFIRREGIDEADPRKTSMQNLAWMCGSGNPLRRRQPMGLKIFAVFQEGEEDAVDYFEHESDALALVEDLDPSKAAWVDTITVRRSYNNETALEGFGNG